ncbi:MAG: GFA family protein [Ferruginibacter sp.]
MPTEANSFRLLSGTPKVYVKTGESGNKREQTFCADCGAPIYSGPPGANAAVVSLRVGTIRQRDQLVPGDQYWFRSAQPWLAQKSPISRSEKKQRVFDARGGFGKD